MGGPTCGLGDGDVDVAFAWLPVPDGGVFRWQVVATERRLVALSTRHRLAGRRRVRFAEMRDEPFVALPAQAGALRDHWLATAQRDGAQPVIGAVARNADEAFEAVANCLGIALVAEGNAAIYQREGIVAVPVSGIPPSELALVWRREDTRDAVRDFIDAATHPLHDDHW